MYYISIWLFLGIIAKYNVGSYKVDLSQLSTSNDGLLIGLCSIPVISALSEQTPTPGYSFSLERGGTIKGDIKVVSVGELDPGLAAQDPEEQSTSKETSDKGGLIENYPADKNPKNPKKFFDLSIRSRNSSSKTYIDHYSWIHLVKCLFGQPLKDSKEEDLKNTNYVKADEDNILDNVYFLLLTQAQWDTYLRSHPGTEKQPSLNSRGFVYSSQIMSIMRIPITKVGETYSFAFEAQNTDRYIPFIFNADEHELKLEGSITYMNPGGSHLPVEMKYHYAVIEFWSTVFILTGLISSIYLHLFLRRSARIIHHMLSLNFLFTAIYLLLDKKVLSSMIKSGTYSSAIWALAHFTKRFQEVYSLKILVMLALGWKLLRETLTAVEFQLIFSVCGISLLLGFLEVMINEIDISRHLIQTLALISVVFATNFNVIVLQSRIADEGLTLQAGAAYSHMKNLIKFRLSFFFLISKAGILYAIRFICLQPTYEGTFIWDEHLTLFLGIAIDYIAYYFFFVNFLPRPQGGLFKHLFRGQTHYLHES